MDAWRIRCCTTKITQRLCTDADVKSHVMSQTDDRVLQHQTCGGSGTSSALAAEWVVRCVSLSHSLTPLSPSLSLFGISPGCCIIILLSKYLLSKRHSQQSRILTHPEECHVPWIFTGLHSIKQLALSMASGLQRYRLCASLAPHL